MSQNPFGVFRQECELILKKVILDFAPKFEFPLHPLAISASQEFGELSSSICFELAKKTGEDPKLLAEKLVEEIRKLPTIFIDKVEALNGYLNFFVNYPILAEYTVKAADKLGKTYGFVKSLRPEKIIVEHTSANPSGPLHVGTARNAISGDALARILKARGHAVNRRFYVDDVGKQVAMVALGYRYLGCPNITGKPDSWIGFVYAATNCAISIRSIKKKIEALQGEVTRSENLEHLKRQLDEYAAIAAELESQNKEVFMKILEGVNADPDPEGNIENIIRLYEKGEANTRSLVRKIVNACLKGFKETLKNADITFDGWDWESEFVWSGDVRKVIERLSKTPYSIVHEGALALDADRAAEKFGIKQKLVQADSYEIPPLVLMRSDETTLYTTRDIAYHLKKFAMADKVINVIGADQKLAQLQLKIALIALDVRRAADNLIHYAYELVKLPGYKMSRRKGRYVTFDEIMDEAINMAYNEVSKRSPTMPENEKRKIANVVGLGAVKYALLSVSATKSVTFSWDKVINFEKNSAPFIQYAHARACSIMRKISAMPTRQDFSLLKSSLEKNLILQLARFPEVFVEAAENLKPEMIAEYANGVADVFNAFYNELPVIKAEKIELRGARLKLVNTTRIVLNNSLSLLGIKAPEKM